MPPPAPRSTLRLAVQEAESWCYPGQHGEQEVPGLGEATRPMHFKKHNNKLTTSGDSESCCLFRREENLCWLRAEKRRKDSRLREARCRKEEVRLKGVRLVGSPLVRSWPTVAVTKCRASWKDLLMVPIHWVMWVWATVSLSPK